MSKCDEINCSILKDFHKKYGCVLDLKFFNWKDLLLHLSHLTYESCENHFERLLDSTLDHSLFIKHPVKLSYQKAFLKLLISEIEENNLNNERVYDKLIEVISKEAKDETHFKHFIIGDDSVITLKENNNFISQGTTGLCTWQAGVALANWCIKNKRILADKKVLELGSGSGLTGLALIRETSPLSYSFSDCHPAVLEQLKHNIHLNQVEASVLNLDWENVEEFDLKPDVVLAADVVYDSSSLPSLCRALRHFINSETVGFVACTVRNLDTIEEFLRILGEYNFAVKKEEFTVSEEDFLVLPPDTRVFIYRIQVNDEQSKIDLLVFGYACKLFRDDEKAMTIDSGSHLIPWMGDETLKIDRYDGRGALYDLSSHEAKADSNYELGEEENALEQMCDEERYRSLYINEEEEIFFREENAKRQKKDQEYSQVQFNYDVPNEAPVEDIPSKPFVPSSDLQIPQDMVLPETVKLNAIIEKTALFVAQQGPQMEILMKVKQQANKNFEFLSHTHQLYAYYLHLKSLIKSGSYVPKEQYDEKEDQYLHPSLAPPPPEEPPKETPKITPPEYMQKIILTMVKYVVKNGNRFEHAVGKRGDVRFSFLNSKNPYNFFYKEELLKAKEAKSDNSKKRKPVPVSFSIKKPKETEGLEVPSALPVEESSEDESSPKETEEVTNSLEKRLKKSSEITKRHREKKDSLLQNERKMKVAQFLKDLKKKDRKD